MANEEVLEGNGALGRKLKLAAEHLDDERIREFAVNIANQIIEHFRGKAYNI